MLIGSLLIIFLVLAVTGVSVAASLGLASFVALIFVLDEPISIIMQRIFAGMDSFPLMAIPLFIIAGNAMGEGGITERIVTFCNAIVGSFRGGLAQINILASMFFGGISGSAVADTSSIGGILIPSMIKEKYEKGFAAAITAFSSGLGPIIPPSITMVVYGIITGTSVTKLFIGGAIPGFLFGIGLMIAVAIIAKKRNYPRHPKSSLKEKLESFVSVFWAILMPFIVIGGILFGIFTVTEAAAIAAVYSLFVGIFIYRGINSISKLYNIFSQSAILVSSIMLLIGAAKLYSYLIVIAQVPAIMTEFIFDFTHNKYLILLMINILMLIIGMFVEASAALVIFVPILFPMCIDIGIDPLHLGVILVFNLCLGLVTPPVGLCLNLASKIAKCKLHQAIMQSVPFYLVGFIILAIITYFSDVVLVLPRLLFD